MAVGGHASTSSCLDLTLQDPYDAVLDGQIPPTPSPLRLCLTRPHPHSCAGFPVLKPRRLCCWSPPVGTPRPRPCLTPTPTSAPTLSPARSSRCPARYGAAPCSPSSTMASASVASGRVASASSWSPGPPSSPSHGSGDSSSAPASASTTPSSRLHAQSISKSLPNEIVILKNLAKQEIVVSNRLVNQLGNFSKLPSFPSARAYMRARIDRAS